jgi:hypothetical protein
MKESLDEGHCYSPPFGYRLAGKAGRFRLITRNLAGIECSHSQVCMISVDDQRATSASDAEGGGQAVLLAGQSGPIASAL